MEKTVHNSDLNHQRYWTVQIWIMKSIFHLFSSTEQGLELVSLFYDFQFARPWIVVFVTILILGKLLLVFFFWVVFVTADLSNFMSPSVCGFSCLWSCLRASVFLFLRKKDITFPYFCCWIWWVWTRAKLSQISPFANVLYAQSESQKQSKFHFLNSFNSILLFYLHLEHLIGNQEIEGLQFLFFWFFLDSSFLVFVQKGWNQQVCQALFHAKMSDTLRFWLLPIQCPVPCFKTMLFWF